MKETRNVRDAHANRLHHIQQKILCHKEAEEEEKEEEEEEENKEKVFVKKSLEWNEFKKALRGIYQIARDSLYPQYDAASMKKN